MHPLLTRIAATINEAPGTLLPESFGSADPEVQSYKYIYNNVLVFAGSLATKLVFAVALIALLFTGYTLVTSLGDEAKLKQAKQSFLFIVIGILVVLSAYLIITTVAPYFVGELTSTQ
ncbi:MAG: hypothetical protein ACOYBJ_02805 [Patescibacteria group bacterium]|jgi:hypothetical protein